MKDFILNIKSQSGEFLEISKTLNRIMVQGSKYRVTLHRRHDLITILDCLTGEEKRFFSHDYITIKRDERIDFLKKSNCYTLGTSEILLNSSLDQDKKIDEYKELIDILVFV